ncbi:MAG: capsule assembly Wzi family protein [Ginsengibacter sp.]
MQIIKSVFIIALLFSPVFIIAQTTYLPDWSKEYKLVNRLEIKFGNNTDINFSGIKPYSRRDIVREAEFIDSAFGGNATNPRVSGVYLTDVDKYNLHSLLMNNSEWVSGEKESFLSKKPILKSFYITKPNLLEVNVKDFFLAVNPVISFQVGKESDRDETLFLNKRGVTARGMIAHRIGFSTTITDNQERPPSFVRDYVQKNNALPGEGFIKGFQKTGYDYFNGSGYLTFNVAKYVDVQFGYDKNFIGDGYRSLFLDDFGNNYLFLKLNTKIWKLNYQNLFMELMPQITKRKLDDVGDLLLDRKYATMHHLSMDITRWLNVGLFEAVVFGRTNHFDFQYLNPIIFLRHIEGTVGSPDNALAGFDFKANVAKRFQFYGQFILDEFHAKQIFKNNGSFANKYGYQLGVKYVDAFTVKNLDLQVETNRVRPFTYSHYDSVANYTHYKQPLAHPLGANFQEYVGIVKYQPLPKVRFDARIIYYYKGLDSLKINMGGNIFRDYSVRPRDFGYFVGGGDRIDVVNASATLGYEFRENLFIEGNMIFRKQTGLKNINVFNIGLRWNAGRKDYSF